MGPEPIVTNGVITNPYQWPKINVVLFGDISPRNLSGVIIHPTYNCFLPCISLGILAHLLRMVSWKLNPMRFGVDWTPQSSAENMMKDA